MTYPNEENLKLPRSKFLDATVVVECDRCKQKKLQLGITAERNWEKNNHQHLCKSCVRKASPAARKCIDALNSNWDDEKRKRHGEKVKNSEKYRLGIENRPDTSGTKNNMFGKKHTIETRAKMSESRKGKIGVNATAWRGGKISLLSRVRVFIQVNHKWYTRCFQRDGWKCTKCGSTTKLDVHHIKPLKKIAKELLKGKDFATEDEQYLFLTKQPEIIDSELKNGITLCRIHHKEIHNNWGSHSPQVERPSGY